MVVTRRQSAAPPPPAASRTNSSQGVGTSRISSASSSKGKSVEKDNNNENLNSVSHHGSPLKNRAGPSRSAAADPSPKVSVGPKNVEDIKFEDRATEPNDLLSEPPPSGKGASSKSKPKPKSKKGPKAKKNRHEKSHKGISIFDILARLFLLWFTIYTISVCPEDVQMRSPICRALTEYRRIILEPYILPPIHAAMQNPIIASAVEPIYSTAAKVTTPVIRRTRQEWRMHVMPQIAWLRIRTRPYARQLQRKYDATLGPYLDDLVLQYRLHVEPRVETAYDNANRKWRHVRPYVRPVWKAAKRLPGALFRILIHFVVNARRKWVDPHVAKIWAAIMEQERASREGIPVVESTDVAEIIDVITSVGVTPISSPATSQDSVYAETVAEVPASVPIPPTFDVTDEIAASIIQDTLSLPSSTPAEGAPEPIDSELANADFPAITDEAAASAASIMAESLSLTVEDKAEETSVGAHTPVTYTEDEEDLDITVDEFLAEISTDVELDSESSPSPEPSVHVLTPEEIEERLRQQQIETAKQRADLENRHTKWEQDIEELGKRRHQAVKEILISLRETAVGHARDPSGLVRKQVTDIVNEAEKSLKGLKAFSKKLLAQDDKSSDERMNEWNDVVAKVEKKFENRVDASAQIITEWIGESADGEMKAIGNLVADLRALGLKAQEDLGMGYTWLEDVTYNDWQRYHKLLETVESFVDVYRGLQNGTEADAPANHLIDIIESLQEEVDDIILGFQASIGQIRSTLLDKLVLSDTSEDVDGTNTESDTKETTLSLGSSAEPEPEMSILPIDLEDDSVLHDDIPKIPPGIIRSRDAEEVRQAIMRAEEGRQVREEL